MHIFCAFIDNRFIRYGVLDYSLENNNVFKKLSGIIIPQRIR